jgi:hypothetical protein
MPIETFHLVIGVLFFAVWALGAALRVGHRDDKAPTNADRW